MGMAARLYNQLRTHNKKGAINMYAQCNRLHCAALHLTDQWSGRWKEPKRWTPQRRVQLRLRALKSDLEHCMMSQLQAAPCRSVSAQIPNPSPLHQLDALRIYMDVTCLRLTCGQIKQV
jgi:hypothetical protein